MAIKYVNGIDSATTLQKDPNAVVGDFSYNSQTGETQILTTGGWKTMMVPATSSTKWTVVNNGSYVLPEITEVEVGHSVDPTPSLPYIEWLLNHYDESYLEYKASYDSLDETYGEDEVNVVLSWADKITGWIKRRINARHDPSCWQELHETLAAALYNTDTLHEPTWAWETLNPAVQKMYRRRAEFLLKDPSLLIMKGDTPQHQ